MFYILILVYYLLEIKYCFYMFYLHLNNGGKDILVYGNSLSYQLILFVRHMCCCFCKACLVNEYTLRYLVKSVRIKHYLQHHSPS